MSGRLFIFRYVPDLARGEQRNLGLAAEVLDAAGVTTVAAKFLDPAQRAARSRQSRALRAVVDEGSGYDEWHHYWTAQLALGSPGLQELLDRQKMAFPVTEAGQVWESAELLDARDLVDRYFEKLILPSEEGDAIVQPANLAERLIIDAGLPGRGDFVKNLRVPSANLTPARTFKFPYGLVNGHTTVMARLPRAGDATVEQALYRFEHIDVGVHKIALIDTARTRNVEAVSYLEDIADVVDVSASDAVDQLLDAIA